MEQQELGIIGEIPQIEEAPVEVVMSWKSETDAVRWSLDRVFRYRPGLTLEQISEFIGVAKGTMTRIAQGSLGISGEPRRLFQQITGVTALTQYEALQFGYVLTSTKKRAEREQDLVALKVEKKQLEAENRQFKKLFSS